MIQFNFLHRFLTNCQSTSCGKKKYFEEGVGVACCGTKEWLISIVKPEWKERKSFVILCCCLQTDEGEDDMKKGTQLLEIYALEIQMYTSQKNNKKLKVYAVLRVSVVNVINYLLSNMTWMLNEWNKEMVVKESYVWNIS